MPAGAWRNCAILRLNKLRARLVELPAPDSPRESEELYQTGVSVERFSRGAEESIPHFTKGSENRKKIAPPAPKTASQPTKK
jgi:hypothetical protein